MEKEVILNGYPNQSSFNEEKGFFVFSNPINERLNAYSIRTGNFITFNGIVGNSYLDQKADNHDDLVKWVKENYPEFKFLAIQKLHFIV